ncbi:hypothetical protein KP509_1Z260800 [Ceratopteris richardii]|nr:hypothetical protein KP509_1Z260800 [Ceratopteris richardii]
MQFHIASWTSSTATLKTSRGCTDWCQKTAEVRKASGKDEMLPSRDEAKRLKKEISSCVVRYYKDSGHTLLLEDGLDLGTTIRGAFLYRKSNKMDPIGDFIYPTTKEFEEAYERSKVLRQMTSPVFFSTKEDGTVVQGLDGVPEDGPVLLVGYHMLLGLELTALVTEFLKRKQLIRGVAHPFLMHGNPEEGLTEPGFADDARVFGGFPAGKKAFFKVLSRKECTLLYPGGTREALHRKGEAYRLFWPERSEFVRAAARFGFTIVPFGVVGEDDLVEVSADYHSFFFMIYSSLWNAICLVLNIHLYTVLSVWTISCMCLYIQQQS